MRKILVGAAVLGLFLMAGPLPAAAYIGPGAGLSAIGSLVALIGAFFLLLAGFVWYPVKRLLRGRTPDSTEAARSHAGSSAKK